MYVQNSRRWVKHIDFILLDVLCLVLSFYCAYGFRNGYGGIVLTDSYIALLLFFVLVHVGIIFLSENYGRVLKRGYYQEFLATIKQTCFMIAAAAVYMFASKHGADFSRVVIFSTFGFYFFLSYAVRNIWKHVIRRKVKNDKKSRNLIIITEKDRTDEVDYYKLISSIDSRNISGIIIMDEDLRGSFIQNIEVVAGKDNMYEYLIRNWVDEVFVDMNPMSDSFSRIFSELNKTGITIHTRIGNYESDLNRISAVETLGKFKVLTTSVRIISPTEQFTKRVFDIVGSVLGLVITIIAAIFIVPAIKIADRGPAIYKSERIGINGKRFKFYKFRSMYMDADERKKELQEQNSIKDGMMFKIEDDPRIIKGIGNFIRKTSIDELPQFWNVLKGDMSLVGTRPPTPDEWEKYGKHHRSRMSVKPGITGMWQVSGRSDIKDFEEVVKLDNQYMTNWNFGLDVKIILQTIVRVIKGSGAA